MTAKLDLVMAYGRKPRTVVMRMLGRDSRQVRPQADPTGKEGGSAALDAI